MGKLWCDGFPTVEVLRSDTPKPVTLVVPYYENRAFFGMQINHWKRYPKHWFDHFSVIVVDDGSPTHPAVDVVNTLGPVSFLRLFRIDVDIRWNWLAARNIGAHHARDGWLILTDMDHSLPPETLERCIWGKHDPANAYFFQREELNIFHPLHGQISPHSASFFLTKQMFWKIGGYDEALSGYYGTDGDWRRRLARHAKIVLTPDKLVRFEFFNDSSTMTYKRKQPEDAAVGKLVKARKPGWKPKTLSFPYHEELCPMPLSPSVPPLAVPHGYVMDTAHSTGQ